MKYRDRKPDLETESFRAWSPTKEEEEELKDLDKDSITIGKGKWKMKLIGYTQVLDKETNKITFAYKMKHEEKIFLYHIPKLSKENLIKINECLRIMKENITNDSKEIN